MVRKKSVAESVEHLLRPKSLAQSDSEDETDLKLSESLANVNNRQRASGILKKHVPLLHELDKKYKGVVSSRKDLERQSDSSGEEEEDDDEEAEDAEDSDDVDNSEGEEEEEEDEDNDLGIGDFINQFKSKVQKDVQEDSDEDDGEAASEQEDGADDSEAEEVDSGEDGDSDTEEEDDVDDDDEEMDNSAEEDNDEPDAASASMKILQPAQENTVQKGQAVRTQLDLWERILETRIKIQPVLNKSNGFPDAETFCQFQEGSEEFSTLAKDTQKNVASLLDNLIDLQNSMMHQFSETKAILKCGLYKRKFVAEQEKGAKRLCLDHQDGGGAEGVFKTYRNSVIQKWSDRTKVTNARNSKELMLNHNIISQIEGVLLNKPDLIKSSQTVKGTYELFGKATRKEGGGDGDQEGEKEEKLSKWSPEIYDDTDFYHQMLRELIEYKSNSSTNPVEAARNYSELQKLRTKIKKQVDQKASKGRKIRYVVHKKIVSYMAPYSDSQWTEEATRELFSSLFGNYEKSLNDKSSGQVEDGEEEEDNEGDMKIL